MNDESAVYTTPAIQTLYRLYRPTTFDADELVGQEHVSRTLKSAIRQGRLAHAYLFCGPRGTGKTSTARLLAKAANCLYPDPDRRPCNECESCRAVIEGRTLDIVEIDAASNRGIDEIRALRDTVQIAPAQLKYRFYIIDECHQLTPAAWNAFLKTLEEPPPHAKFVLCTTEPEKLLDTVASRCQRFDFHRIGVSAIVALMRRICGQEGLAVTDEALEAIARQATGSARDALSLLDTLASYGTSGEGITLDTVRNVLGAGSNERVLAVVDALAANDIGAGIVAVNAAAEVGVEPGVLAGQIVAALRALLYAAYGVSGVAELADAALIERLPRFAAPELAYMTKLFSQTEFRLKHTAYGHLPLELAVVDAVLMRTGQAPAMQTVAVPQSQPAASYVPPQAEIVTPPAPTTRFAPVASARPIRPASAPPALPVPVGSDEDEMPVSVPRPDRFRRERDAAFTPSPLASGSPMVPVPPTSTLAPTPSTPSPPPAPMVAASVVPEVDASSSTAVISLEQLDSLWNRIKQRVKMEGRSKAYAMLLDTNPYDVRGNTVVLTTIGTHHCEYLNGDEVRLLLEKVIGEVVGAQVRVTCELHGGGDGGSSSGATSDGRAARPSRVARPTSPTPELFEPPIPIRPVVATADAPAPLIPDASSTAPPPVSRDKQRTQQIGNLFDAQVLDPEDAPPFPDGD